jgi:hypothetical protein
MRPEQEQITHPRLLRTSDFGGGPADKEIKVDKKTEKAAGSRFVGPELLDEGQRVRIGKALKAKKIGDEMGREIFICALEYQIGSFASLVPLRVEKKSEPEAGAPDPTMRKALREIVENAANLSRLLRALPDEALDRVTEMLGHEAGLWRGYDGRYLGELGLEIDRLERACIAAGGEPEPEPPEPEPEPSADPAASRELITKLGEIFTDCFEMKPTAEEGGPFCTTLEVLAEVTGLAIEREPAFLARVLEGQGSKRRGK